MTKGMSFAKQIGIALVVIAVIASVLFLLLGDLSGLSLNPFTNVTQLAISDAVPIDCDVINLLELQFEDGTKRIAYTGRDGYIPNTQSLSIVDSSGLGSTGKNIDEVHIQLALQCAGSLMRASGSVTVTGTNQQSLCTYLTSSTKECLTISGSSFTGKQAVITKPFTYQDGIVAVPIPTTTITDRETKVIWQGILTTDDVARLYGDPPRVTGVHSTMFPQIQLTFSNGQRLGIDALAENDRTTTSWSGWTYVAPPSDTDQDGIDDLIDDCPTLPETFNGFRDSDGCPDSVLDADADGIDDDNDICPNTELGVPVTTVGSSIGCSNAQIEFLNNIGKDDDGDGIFNNDDTCPNIAGGGLDGCPVDVAPMDSDGDGILDDVDQCPNTNISATINSVGCPIDQICPDEPTITPVDANGDGFIDNCSQHDDFGQGDQDGDGVIDRDDLCPDTLFGLVVNSFGCHDADDAQPCPQGLEPNPDGTCPDAFAGLTDSDNDGVNDAEDICPNTPANTDVDSSGCELPSSLDFGDFFTDDIPALFNPSDQPVQQQPTFQQPVSGNSIAPPFSIADNIPLIIMIIVGSVIAVIVFIKVKGK